MKPLIYISGIFLFGSFLLILLSDFSQEWKQTQAQFIQIEENRFYSTSEEGLSFNQEITQLIIPGLNRVDRCPTCHLGINDEKYITAPAPFTNHPGDLIVSHPIKDFGCTSCHFGQGYAVSYEGAAHEKLEFWNENMLPKELIQASCGTCHLSEEVPQADILTNGRLLIRDKGCTGCHDINEFFEEEARGPDLAGIGNKVTRGWLYHWLKNPKKYLKNSRMPTYQLKDDEILSLMEYLMSLNSKDSPPHFIEKSPIEAGDEDAGKIIISESRCISCHTIKGRGGKFAPEMERIGDKVREDWLANFLRNVHYYQPKKKMLEYNFTDQNALDVAAYIFEEYSEEEYTLPEEIVTAGVPFSPSRTQEQIRKGKKLFSKYGCGGCHTIGGVESHTKVGPKLTNIGNRLESSLDFGIHNNILPTLYNWLFMKLKQPDVFDSMSTMPNYYMTDEEAFEITVALLGNKNNDYTRDYLVYETEQSLYKKPAGTFGELFERYSCISCHSIDKYGGEISTAPLTIEGSKVKFEWLRDYLIKPFAIRPLLTERMPRFRMTDKEASLMADYIKTVYVSDEIPRFFEYELTSLDEKAGSHIFDTMQCVNCHIIEGAGGYVGAQLDDVANRLEAGWIYKWLLHPLEYKPETIHPDFDFTESEAKQLTAYLMTKKGRRK